MSKILPPKGYYTATQVKGKLNISDAMIRYYVQKDKIQYLVPPGRKQGFYLAKDVDILVNELNAFLNFEVRESSKYEKATAADLIEIEKLGMTLFAPELAGSVTKPAAWREVTFNKNPDSQYVLRNAGEIVGYISLLPLQEHTDKIEKLFRVDLIQDVNITSEDVAIFERGKHINLYVGAIGVKPSLNQHKKKHYGASLISGLARTIADLGRDGVIIDSLAALGASPSGRRLLQSFGFCEDPPRVPGKRVFVLDILNSGSPISLQYKEALKESGVLKAAPAKASTKKKESVQP